jgi:acyl-CoA hydrolase
MEPKAFSTYHLIKSEDLNHHGTLFAGRSAEWFVESGFVSAASLVDPKDIICLKIHGMHFSKPMKIGQIARFTSKIVYTGKSSMICNVKVSAIKTKEIVIVDGYLTFIHVDENNRPKPHGITITPATDEDKQLYEVAKELSSAHSKK